MSKDNAERIAKLKEKREKLAIRLNALEQKDKDDRRKRDTRRKIIVGGAVLTQMEKDSAFASIVRQILAQSVGRQNDRETISDLLVPPPQPAQGTTAAAPATSASLVEAENEMARYLANQNGESQTVTDVHAPHVGG